MVGAILLSVPGIRPWMDLVLHAVTPDYTFYVFDYEKNNRHTYCLLLLDFYYNQLDNIISMRLILVMFEALMKSIS